ncbi:LLM class flavin-dependent oxidoreductase [Dactylosporangium sp. NPDC005572]|uniref:LLM class flavin-dependent oxidoreductase n=1 Tax=Dactylosporangium sp. NPDC005572 TaxID=3156889 RepID=UPI0033A6113D
MKFLASTLLAGAAAPVTERDRFAEAVDLAVWAERLGYDAFGLGQRHSPAFLSSSPAVTLAHIAARTSRIRLMTTVAVLSLADPVRAAEDYATLDQLSDGRLDLVIGKGNDPASPRAFGVPEAQLWDRLEEGYELLRRLWREDDVTWTGRFRPPLSGVTVRPKPLQRPAPRVWHGSATSERSVDLAAKWGDPLYSANGFRPAGTYLALVERYRERLAAHGHDPSRALVGVGAHAPVVTSRSQDAYAIARPAFEAFRRSAVAAANGFPYDSLEDFVERGSALVGSPGQVTAKLLDLHRRFGNQLFGVGVEGFFVPDPAAAREHLERFFAEVVPVVRAEAPTPDWLPVTP